MIEALFKNFLDIFIKKIQLARIKKYVRQFIKTNIRKRNEES